MIVGKLVDCEEKLYGSLLPSVRDIVLEVTKRYNFPIIGNADFGHNVTNMPMPEGFFLIWTEKPSK
jgi:muramoyltetrapeptide carboxypeptidase LdcA involved in peptidoglycan recycling